MNKLFTIFCTTLILFLSNLIEVKSQVILGTQAVQSGTTGIAPYNRFWQSRRVQMVYTAAEITAGGGAPGNITALSWDISQVGLTGSGGLGLTNYVVKMAHTTATNAATHNTTTLTTVKNAFAYNPIVTGWGLITFDTPFLWDGTSNILVDVCWGVNPGWNGSGQVWMYNETVINSTRGISEDPTNQCANNTDATIAGKARVKFDMPLIPCSATLAGGTAVSPSLCAAPINLSVNNSTIASGLTYQWQYSPDGIATYTNVASATLPDLVLNAPIQYGFYRRTVTCTAASSTATSTTIFVKKQAYAVLPFMENFNTGWQTFCTLGTTFNSLDIPSSTGVDVYWKNTPLIGNNSMRRQNEGNGAGWRFYFLNPLGPDPNYSPIQPFGSTDPVSTTEGAATFHSWGAVAGTTGALDLYLDCSTGGPGPKRVSFKYNNLNVNPIIPNSNLPNNDVLTCQVSINGGPFSTLGTVGSSGSDLANPWADGFFIFDSNSPNTILRFSITSDFGKTDFAFDNVEVVVIPDCATMTTPVTGGIASASLAASCSPLNSSLTVSNASDFSFFGFVYQWQRSIDGGITFTNITGATASNYNVVGQTITTRYRRLTTCTVSGSTGASSVIQVSVLTPSYALPPFKEDFEASWMNVCAIKDVPPAGNGVFYWKNLLPTGTASWRRQDEGSSSNWNNGANVAAQGIAPPDPTDGGTGCANYNSAWASSPTVGSFDLYANLSTAPVHRLNFGYVNNGGSDKLRVFLSTNGGTTFTPNFLIELGKTRAASPDDEFPGSTSALNCYSPYNPAGPAAVWTKQTILIDQTFVPTATSVIRFQGTADFGWTNIAIDNVALQPLFAQDAGISKINLIRCSPRFANVQVEITNYGFQSISNFPIGYTLDGGAQVTEIYAGTIDAYKTATYTFVAPVDLTLFGASININSTTLLLGDGNNTNNALLTNIAVPSLGGGSGLFVPYTENFNSVATGNLATGWSQPSSGSNWFLAVANPGGAGVGNQFPNDPGSYGNPISGGGGNTTKFMALDDYSRNGVPLPVATGFGANANAYLIAPAFNFTNTTNIRVRFDAYFNNDLPTPTFSLKASLDNGSTWVVLPGGTINVGTWATYTVNMPVLYENKPSVLLAFHYDDKGRRGEGGAVDNFSITGNLLAPPVVQATFTTPVVPDRYVERGTISHPIYKMGLKADASSNITLSDFIATTAGSYQLNDIVVNSFKLWYSTDTTLNAGDELLAARAIVPTGGKILFNCINKIVPKGRVGYFIVSADIESGATIGRTIQITLPILNVANPAPSNTADIILLTGVKIGTLTAGGVQTIVGANIPPTSADFTVSTRINTPYVFSVFDFAFSDLNAPDQFSGLFKEVLLQTTNSPAIGSGFSYDGVPIVANPINQRIKVADIPKLKFTAAPGDVRTDYARFTFKVYDGRAYSANSYTGKVDITGDNLFFPNIFTPNTVDSNNSFKLLCNNPSRIADFGLKIYDRNNNLLYETTDLIRMINIGWDGKNKDGNTLPTGAYLWAIQGKFTDGKDLKINEKTSGIIRLVR